MKPADLIEKLKALPQDKDIMCQVVGQETSAAWNMYFEFQDVEKCSFIQLRIWHPQLKDVSKPVWDQTY